MTIAAYQTMYESSIAFGIRKALIAEQRKAEMEAKVCTIFSRRQKVEYPMRDQACARV